jgi:hypothetical protein
MEESLLQETRTACRQVAERAVRVAIDFDRIPDYAASLPVAEALCPEIDPDCHYLDQGADTVAFFLTLDAVNFGSGYFSDMGMPPGRSGYFTIAGALADRFRTRGPYSAAHLCRMTTEDCLTLFGQDPGNRAAVELMAFFAQAFNDLGRYLMEQFDGRFTALVEAAGGRAARFVELLTEMPLYRDVADYQDLRVPFYKRAQLTVADLAIAFEGRDWGAFADLADLTLFADNLVPHVLRHDGILIYQKGLAARIDAGETIPAGSAEEVEIRACAVHVVELLVAELHRRGHQVTAMGLDQLLWNRGQQPAYRARPRHRTKTVFY